MALVAMTSVQFTTPMRTFWQEGASAAKTLVLKMALALNASTQRLISRFMVVPSAGRYCGGRRLYAPCDHVTQLEGRQNARRRLALALQRPVLLNGPLNWRITVTTLPVLRERHHVPGFLLSADAGL